MKNQKVVIFDFGGQYGQLIARRVRECSVLSVIKPFSITVEELKSLDPIGIIFTGGPNSVYSSDSPKCDKAIFDLGIPVLGICYGMQLLSYLGGGEVASSEKREFGQVEVKLELSSPLFEDLGTREQVLMSHGDKVDRLPEGFRAIASSESCPFAAIENQDKKLFGLQFHPEVKSTPHGAKIIRNFLYNVCGAKGDYNMRSYIKEQIRLVREKVGNEKVLLALSGGVDSSVVAMLLSKAIPGQLTCVFVDHGLMRKNEGDQVENFFKKQPLTFIRVNAGENFLAKLKGVTDPESKRKIIGAEFIETFTREAEKLGDVKYLAQGTIYPDIIESGTSNSAVIKSHHNVGGLPKNMRFIGLVEPLRDLFKDEVRKIGRILGLDASLVNRQPFPGPGLGIRVIGEVTEEKLKLLREADAIFREELTASRAKADQYFAVLTNNRSVGVMGDDRTYEYTLALRAVRTTDFMTCDYARLPYSLLTRVSQRITNEVKGINRVVYDITAKPPATIEWE